MKEGSEEPLGLDLKDCANSGECAQEEAPPLFSVWWESQPRTLHRLDQRSTMGLRPNPESYCLLEKGQEIQAGWYLLGSQHLEG